MLDHSVVPQQARSLGLINSKNQWLFVVPNSHSLRYDMDRFLANMNDGDNMAFIYNMSILAPVTPCDILF
ncbi:hypothetical protein SK128_009072 [Halocaridina rubra]|uniref:Uncharacterized protein n=1 Tax=Halocaridina rubra TaxID=373956 RepID=A0AAN8XJI7_HALRR